MKRAFATELTLVNWKGVFYERYLLDRNVTALEGDNGAGKTTVMIAAYLVLLPDLSRLRFTNLGETGATGGDKGIWGRLGQLGRPSYSALTLRLGDGAELIAGVVVLRKAEPALELRPFIISDLPKEARGRDYLLRVSDEHDEIPTVGEVEQAVAAAGAKIELFSTCKAYFASLFELGVSPMRLGSDEERNKYNDMLRTSMTGGISRALTSELRSFVFKQESGLADTLGRMRGSLTACRKTRLEVAESRQLERHISGIFDAGASMFEAAVLAASATAAEKSAELARARRALDEAEAQLVEQSLELSEASARQGTIEPRLAAAQASADEAKRAVERYQRCLATAQRLDGLRGELAYAERALTAMRAQSDVAAERRSAARARRTDVQASLLRSAQGLANLQTGLEELHRRVHAERHVSERLSTAVHALESAGFETSQLEGLSRSDDQVVHVERVSERLQAVLRRATEQLAQTDVERAERARLAQSAGALRREYDRALAALDLIACEATDDVEPIERARAELARLGTCSNLAARLPQLRADLSRLQRCAQEHAELRAQADALGVPADTGARELSRLVGELDAEVRRSRDVARETAWLARELSERVERCAAELAELDHRAARYRSLRAAADRLLETDISVTGDDVDLDGLGHELSQRLSALKERIVALDLERTEALSAAARLDAAAHAPDAELCRLRDLVSGELLSQRFEDIEPEPARYVEARLGPLRDAIVVEDIAAAQRLLAEEDRELHELWLVSASTDLTTLAEPVTEPTKDVLVETEVGVRICRVPDVATLGRTARLRRAAALRKIATARHKTLEEEERQLRKLQSAARDLQRLRDEHRVWLAGDPQTRIEQLTAQRDDLASQAEQRRDEARAASERATSASARAEALRPLLARAALLEPSVSADELAAASARVTSALQAQTELERTADAQATLQQLLDVLRQPPPDERTLAQWAEQARSLDALRDALFSGIDALQAAAPQLHALTFSGTASALDDQTRLVPELEEQHQRLEQAAADAEAALAESEVVWESATEALQECRAQHAAIAAHVERAVGELRELGVEAPDAARLDELSARCDAAERALGELREESRGLAARTALATERRASAAARRDTESANVARIEQHSAPAQRAWQRAQELVRELGLKLPGRTGTGGADRSSELWPEARGRRQLLIDRLLASGEAAELQSLLSPAVVDDAMVYVELWQAVRAWLHKRLPAQVAEVADPLDALLRLRDDLSTLETRLRHQEHELRGASEDVARSIDAQVRRASRQVRRINQYLEGIRFGSIVAIRIKLGRVEKMAQVLDALRDGSAQKLLFQAQLPFEEALDEIFHRYGGGRGGGHRILDYREYIDLQVEVRRRVEDAAWEVANPTRVSTGEAIGVGAALMMVILTEWERDANLMRGSRRFGSLRFLFLDEANRLSQDNLGVLFELCQSLQLQLLIAAPEVARSEGNTTYRLVRRVAEDGTEEVLVTGRRASLPERDLPASDASGTSVEDGSGNDASNWFSRQLR